MNQIPHKCPVCDGTGVVAYPPGTMPGQGYTTRSTGPWPCHVCKGVCLIWGPPGYVNLQNFDPNPWNVHPTSDDPHSNDPHKYCDRRCPCSTACPGQGDGQR